MTHACTQAKAVFKKHANSEYKLPNNTRFWAEFECKEQLFLTWPSVEFVLNELTERKICPKSSKKAQEDQKKKTVEIEVELGAYIDGIRPFVETTYTLEGDGGNLPFDTWTKIDSLYKHINNFRAGTHPNLSAILRKKFQPDGGPIVGANLTAYNAIVDYGRKCIEPAFKWFEAKFAEEDMAAQLEMFKAARMCDPRQHQLLEGDANDVYERLKSLALIPQISTAHLAGLEKEYPKFLQCASSDPVENYKHENDDSDADALQRWWLKYVAKLPLWSRAFDACMLLVPSSCSAERAFSLLKATFKDNQKTALNDYVELAVMAQFNSNKKKKDR